MKIVLAAINAKYIHSNLAVYSLQAYARDVGAVIEIAEYTINQQTDEILRDLYKKKPDVLAISCYIWNIRYVEEVVRELKKVRKEVKIWLGGPEVSYDAVETLQRLPQVQGIIKGEGEQTFKEVAAYYQKEQSGRLEEILGIVYRDEQGEIHENAWRPVMDLNEVPFVYRDMSLFAHKIIYYESSRGCPFRCSYCLSSVDKQLRFRDVERVKKELQYLIDQKVPQVKFVDRTFNCKQEHSMAIWRYIHEHDNGITNFHFEISADLLNEEAMELMRQMRPGLIQLEIGVQSTNPETVHEIRRTMRFEEVAKYVKRINQYGNIHQHLDLIAGLPYEDFASFHRSFNDVYALAPEQLQLGFLKVLKGSYMEETKTAYELVCKEYPPYEVLSTKWLSYEEVLRLKGIEEMVELYYNSRQFCYTLPYLVARFGDAFAMFDALRAFYESEGYVQQSQSRASRYEILLKFIEKADAEHLERDRQLLILDYYIRENAKSRPAFAGEETCDKEFVRAFYEKEEEARNYLRDYVGCDKRKLRKMTHIERFDFDVLGTGEEQETILLFDYQKRSPLDHQVSVYRLCTP